MGFHDHIPAERAASVSLRLASEADEAILYRIYASTREDELALIDWNESQRRAFLRMQFDARQRSYRLDFPEAEERMVLRDGVPIGYMMIDRSDERFLLIDLALLPEHRDAGIGTTLIRDLQEESKAEGKPIRLHVEVFNRALRLYERLGFETIGETGIHREMRWRSTTEVRERRAIKDGS